jgi:hypothetical protein
MLGEAAGRGRMTSLTIVAGFFIAAVVLDRLWQ